jgi:hypothetical protein
LRPRQTEPFRQCRYELVAGVNDVGYGGFSNAIEKAGVESERLKAALSPHGTGAAAVVLMIEKPGQDSGIAGFPVCIEFWNIPLEKSPHMLITEVVLFFHQIAYLVCGIGEERGAAGIVVGPMLNPADNKLIETDA